MRAAFLDAMKMKPIQSSFNLILALVFCTRSISSVFADPVDCKDAQTLTDCYRACQDVEPPEIDFRPPWSQYLNRYNDCLRKAYKTYRFPTYWFSGDALKDRYRGMFLKNLLSPAVSPGRASSCEGKNLPMPVLIEEWESGMLTRVVGVSRNKWINIYIPGITDSEGLSMGTISGNQNRYYEDVNVGYAIYTRPMNVGEEPELYTETTKNGEPFRFSFDGMIRIPGVDISSLPIPSDDIIAVNEYGFVLWSGFAEKQVNPNAFILRPGNLKFELGSTANYEYNRAGLPVRVTTSVFNVNAQSFKQNSEVCTEFDKTGHLKAIHHCTNDNTPDPIISFIYEKDNHCPIQMNDANGQPLYRFVYNHEHRLTRIYQTFMIPDKPNREIRIYYANDADYNWPIRNLKFSYSKPLKKVPDNITPAPEGMKLFNPNQLTYIPKHFARPFYMDLKPVTQKDFQLLMGRNPSFFHSLPCETMDKQCEWRIKYAAEWGIGPSSKSDTSNHPVENITWYDALAYANARSKSESLEECYQLDECETKEGWFVCKKVSFKGLDCKGYRLPTSEESKLLDAEAPFDAHRPVADNCIKMNRGWKKGCFSTYPVDTAKPDRDGLYDHRGNIYEWLWDWYGPKEGYCWGVFCDDRAKRSHNQHNSLGPTTGICRALSGSSFGRNGIYTCYPPDRGGSQIGFRLVRTAMW